MVVLVAWQSAEGTDAAYNPLATTYREPGSTDFNSVGVQNYASLAQGIDAIHKTLEASSHGYEQILAGLAASADPMTTGEAINASDWCHGCTNGQYVIELFEYLAPQGTKADVTPWNVGASHVCFLVDDLPALYERLRAQGVDFVSPPVEVDSGVNRGGYGVYLRDPDGITLELFQPPASRAE